MRRDRLFIRRLRSGRLSGGRGERRLSLDFGFGVQFAVTSEHFAQRLYRTEIRWRF